MRLEGLTSHFSKFHCNARLANVRFLDDTSNGLQGFIAIARLKASFRKKKYSGHLKRILNGNKYIDSYSVRSTNYCLQFEK